MTRADLIERNSAVRLVAGSERTVKAVSDVVESARQLAADREEFSPKERPSGKFKPLWDEEQEFINACRAELELDAVTRYGSRAGPGITPAKAEPSDAGSTSPPRCSATATKSPSDTPTSPPSRDLDT